MINRNGVRAGIQGGGCVMFDSKSLVLEVVAASAGNKSYRCYFTDGDDRIQSYEQIECEDDTQAVLTAQALLDGSHFASAELWLGKRLVGKWSNGGTTKDR